MNMDIFVQLWTELSNLKQSINQIKIGGGTKLEGASWLLVFAKESLNL